MTRRARHALAAAAVLAGAPAAPAAASEVRVVPAGGAARTLDLTALLASPDVVDRAYTLRDARGGARTRRVTGVSLGAVLRAAQLDLEAFRHAEVQAADGRAVTFSRDQALARDAAPPVFTASGFLRTSAGPDDANAGDAMAAAPFTVRLRQALRLRVRASVSPARPAPGRAARFVARVQGAAAGEPVRVSWFFGPGEGTARGEEVRHAFGERRRHRVVVTATTPGDEVGVSAVLVVPVGRAEREAPEARGASAEEAAPARSAASGGAGAGGGSGGGGGGGAGAAAGGAPAAAPASSAARRRPARRPSRAARAPAGAGRVAGEVLEALPAAQPAPAGPAAATPRPAGSAAGDAAGAGAGFALSAEALAVLALLGAATGGFLLERRRLGIAR